MVLQGGSSSSCVKLSSPFCLQFVAQVYLWVGSWHGVDVSPSGLCASLWSPCRAAVFKLSSPLCTFCGSYKKDKDWVLLVKLRCWTVHKKVLCWISICLYYTSLKWILNDVLKCIFYLWFINVAWRQLCQTTLVRVLLAQKIFISC